MGWTPLHGAAIDENEETIQMLLDKGADVNARNRDGSTALETAASDSRKELVELFLTKGADVNAADDMGYTALHRAAEHGQEEIVKLLLAQVANVNVKLDDIHDAMTPLMLAVERRNKTIVNDLLAKGADPNAHTSRYRE